MRGVARLRLVTMMLLVCAGACSSGGGGGTGGAAGGGGSTGSGGTGGTMGEAGRGGGAGTTGGAGGTTGSGGTGGAGGTTGSGGTGGAAGTGGSASTCPTEPGTTNATCETCTSTNCTVGPNGTDGCCLASATDQALCVALYTCFISNACTQYGDPTKCFCGTSDSQTCWAAAGAANGPCVAETTAAAKAQDLPTIRARFISPLFPIGRAVNLAACRGGLCMTECSIR